MPTKKERDEYLRGLNPIDDLMFRKMAEHKEFCEEILRVILDDYKLVVTDNMQQFDIKNLQGRSVVLDAKCITGDGRYINIEVQKANDDNHLKRVRYNASVLTANVTETGKKFEFVPDICIIFISAFDLFKGNLPLYHVKKVVVETEQIIDDGLTEIYVNAAVDDGSKLAKLMKVFTNNDVYNEADFPVTSEIKARFKKDEGGTVKMDATLQKWMQESEEIGEKRGEKRGREEGIMLGKEEGIVLGKEEGAKTIAKTMIEEGLPTELIMRYTGLSEEAVAALHG
ncbi:Rpn family recombination-promoting nuclease/putative transposase [Catonella massiliensis]|uniref:Rpn family recombination-promoting nuclease/putative transposase n=2 Tax=Catonella massiliensis TaxID=2799636 RepID=A0ABS1IXH1_9FIRM|nr:Rpn family recombination-promoting nuclease/putative transposase [Catonella massiliensis]MBK5896537.1 Rpn family recombination-promoting nuclease/putative transposase [Catonella massiliensis]